jgi:glycosyltransferase involved in cell wall biosynthesis
VPDPQSPVILGWTGVRDNLGYFAPIEPVLQKLAQEYNIELWISSDGEYELEGVQVRNRVWCEAEEVDYVREVDIGLMPLHDTPRARGKCAFKALQHMAVAVPVIISPVGMNTEVVQDGVNGLLAGLPEEWEDKLRTLIENPELREQLGRAGRKTVEEQYSFTVNYPKLKAVLEQVAKDTP